MLLEKWRRSGGGAGFIAISTGDSVFDNFTIYGTAKASEK
jgi:hypothetical protein